MEKKNKPRHWIAIILAVASLIIALIALADFSGEPPPRWREILNPLLPPCTLAMIFLNLSLDKKLGKK